MNGRCRERDKHGWESSFSSAECDSDDLWCLTAICMQYEWRTWFAKSPEQLNSGPSLNMSLTSPIHVDDFSLTDDLPL